MELSQVETLKDRRLYHVYILFFKPSKKLEICEEDIRKLFNFQYKLCVNASKATQDIFTVFDPSTLTTQTAYNWYKRFDNGDFSIEDKPRFASPMTTNLEHLKRLIQEDPNMTTRSIAEALGVSYNTVDHHMRQMGLIPKLGVWVPHDLIRRKKSG